MGIHRKREHEETEGLIFIASGKTIFICQPGVVN